MTFNIYDLLSQVIPGFLVYLSFIRMMGIPWDKDYVVATTVLAFFAGYFVSAIGSWLENFYYWTWGGKPSNQLLAGKGIKTTAFYHAEEVKKLLSEETENSNPKPDELFSIAMRYANGIKDTRIEAFNANYAFSRNILTACIISVFLLFKEYSGNVYYILLITMVILIAWQRCKERGFYLAREVLQVYLRLKKPPKAI